MNTHRWMFAVVAAMTLVGCDGSSNDATHTVAPDPVREDRVLRDVDVGGSETDIFLPTGSAVGGAAAPVVVMLHGTSGNRSRMEPLAAAVADGGALVHVPSWPVIDQVAPFPEDQGDEPYRRQSEAIICLLRSVKKTAAEFGGDPNDVTLVGHSGGGMIGARVAIVDEPPWPRIDCDADINHAPDRFIGLAGDYLGEYQYATTLPDLYGPYDVLAIEPTNRNLDVWLLNGQNDDAVNVLTSALFADRLQATGIGSHFLTTDTGHAAPLDTSTPAGRFTADRITAIVHGRVEPQWWPGTAADATLRLGADDTCEYNGPETWSTDRAITIQLENEAGVAAWFALVSIRSDVEITREEALASAGTLGVDDPDWVDWGGFRPVPPGESRMLHFAFVEADQTFVAFCHIESDTGHPRAGWMFPAALLAPSQGPIRR